MSIAMIIAFGATTALWALDARVIDGISVWAKPLKFELALAIHAGTLGLVVSRLRPSFQRGLFISCVALAFLVACTIEMGWIIYQASQGQHSHFNHSTGFHRAMFSVMAFAAVIITGAAAAIAFQVWRDPGFDTHHVLKTGILLGLSAGTALTLVTAFAIGGMGSPYVGNAPSLNSRMMLTGWSLTSGDLRVSHFLATHMMQAVPIAAVLMIWARIGSASKYALLGFAAFWTIWVMLEFGVALSGEPAFLVTLGL
jgi:hypothetical protein